MSSMVSPLTDRVYRSSWNLFCRWCGDSGRPSLPASPDVVLLYVAWCVKDVGYRLSSVRAHVASIRYWHRVAGFASPVDSSVTDFLSGLSRQLKERPRGRRALTPSQLGRVSVLLSADGSPIAARDRALLVLGFALGWRGSELARLHVADISVERKGLRIFQGWSKTDQEGKGREVGIPRGLSSATCPVVALDDWLRVRGAWPGPLFVAVRKGGDLSQRCITGEVVNQVLKSRMLQAGMDAENFGSHSLRAGCVTAAAEGGATELAIMHRTGHKSIEMVLRYTRPARAFAVDPLAGVL